MRTGYRIGYRIIGVLAAVLAGTVGTGCSRTAPFPEAAEVFAPGSISLPDSNLYRGAFTPDGRGLYFVRGFGQYYHIATEAALGGTE